MKLTKKRYLQGFAATTLALALVRLVFPSVAQPRAHQPEQADTVVVVQPVVATPPPVDEVSTPPLPPASRFTGPKHRIWSVRSYSEAFPDTNALQLTAARRWGVTPVKNRADAEARKKELVFVGSSPYYHIDPLYSSIPYLVPRAAVLLNDLGQAFFDSLYVKGIPLHQFIVTSVLRTQDDVARLRTHNGNATENSCHLYGTTFDICYNRYKPVTREVRNDSLKFVLSEVLRDQRQQGRCYIKYEKKQGCYHMTVR